MQTDHINFMPILVFITAYVFLEQTTSILIYKLSNDIQLKQHPFIKTVYEDTNVEWFFSP